MSSTYADGAGHDAPQTQSSEQTSLKVKSEYISGAFERAAKDVDRYTKMAQYRSYYGVVIDRQKPDEDRGWFRKFLFKAFGKNADPMPTEIHLSDLFNNREFQDFRNKLEEENIRIREISVLNDDSIVYGSRQLGTLRTEKGSRVHFLLEMKS